MYESLKAALENRKKPEKMDESTGKIVDILKRIAHFQQLNQLYGTQYITLFIPLLDTLILRSSSEILNENNQYIILQGELLFVDQTLTVNQKNWPLGKLLDLKEELQGIRYIARTDCYLLRINKELKVKRYIEKKILGKDKEKTQKYKEFKRIIEKSEEIQKVKSTLSKIQFFSCLGDYDFHEMLIDVQLKEYNQGGLTHQFNNQVKKIGYLLEGKIKMKYFDREQENKGSLDRITQKYKIVHHKDINQKGTVCSYCIEGDWIGLQQYLWEDTFKSTGQSINNQTLILWIPTSIFNNKFNIKTNYNVINKLLSLVETRKSLLDRSANTRRKKEAEIHQETQRLHMKINEVLVAKISQFQLKEPKQQRKLSIRRFGHEHKLSVPEKIMHTLNFEEEKALNLPFLKERFMLFPEEYKNALVTPELRRELQRAEELISKPEKQLVAEEQLNKTKYTANNPEKIYKTIFDKISYKYHNDMYEGSLQKHINSKTLETIQRSRKIIKEDRNNWKEGIHYNKSIYNNFKINKENRAKHRKNMLSLQSGIDILDSTFY